MSCKIDRVLTPDGFVILRVSGRLDRAQIEALWKLTESEKTTNGIVFDLTQLTLASREAVEVLSRAEDNGIELRNCPAYVREWISRVRERGLCD